MFFCQTVRWLTSSLKLGQYKYIACSGRVLFLKFFVHIPGMFSLSPNNLISFMSVRWLTYLLTEIRPMKGYLTELVQRHSLDVCSLVQSMYEILVYLSVCLLANILKKIKLTQVLDENLEPFQTSTSASPNILQLCCQCGRKFGVLAKIGRKFGIVGEK